MNNFVVKYKKFTYNKLFLLQILQILQRFNTQNHMEKEQQTKHALNCLGPSNLSAQNQIDKINEIKCNCGKQVRFICIEKQCKSSALICEENQPQCGLKYHKKCLTTSFKKIVSKFEDRILDVSKYVEEHQKIVDDFVDRLIDQASSIKNLYKNYAEKHYKFSMFNQAEKNIWNQLHSSHLNQIKGFQFSKLFFAMNEQKQQNLNIEEEQAQIAKKWKDIEDLVIIQMKQFQSQLLSHKINLQLKLQQNKVIFQSSSIIQTLEEKQTMLNFLNRKIKKVELLYKASQNQFKLDNFYNKCTNIPNTLVLIKTEFDKKVGGFTPLCWKKVQTQQRLVDTSNSSFIFSLTNNEKLMQTSLTDSGIWNYKNCGPIFGLKNSSCDIAIYNEANKNNNSGIRFGYGYSNSTYKKETKQLYQRFSGNPDNSHSTSLLQWQVWSVTFQQ